ncbi:hypothetical protein PG990_010211 [Apiospora arundinis]
MSENKISLRSGGKRKGRPTISAPRQISGPIPNDGIDVPRSSGGVLFLSAHLRRSLQQHNHGRDLRLLPAARQMT